MGSRERGKGIRSPGSSAEDVKGAEYRHRHKHEDDNGGRSRRSKTRDSEDRAEGEFARETIGEKGLDSGKDKPYSDESEDMSGEGVARKEKKGRERSRTKDGHRKGEGRRGSRQHKSEDSEEVDELEDGEKERGRLSGRSSRKRDREKKSRRLDENNSDEDSEESDRKDRKGRGRKSGRKEGKGKDRRRGGDDDDDEEEDDDVQGAEKDVGSHSDASKSDDSMSASSGSDVDGSGTESEEERARERRRRKRKERKKDERRKEKEKDRRRREKRRRKKEEAKREEKKAAKKAKKEQQKRGPVTEFGKYGLVREIDMWNRRPEFSCWLQEVKKMNLESMTGAEEKQLFKDYMEDYNTATMPSMKYYNLAAWESKRQMKAALKGLVPKATEMTEFNDEEIKRREVAVIRAQQKEEEVRRLKNAMQAGMAQNMIEQARLKEDMQYHYRLGNFEEAGKIQRLLDPDVLMYK